MAILPLPQRGQPVDYDYLYQITEAVNRIGDEILIASRGNIIDTKAGSPKKNISVAETVTVAKKYTVKITSSQAAGVDREFSIDFDTTFDYPPVVTITAKRNEVNNNAEVDVLVLTSITTTGVKGIINTTATGTLNVELQMIAVGIKAS
jgi:hypothetical protein